LRANSGGGVTESVYSTKGLIASEGAFAGEPPLKKGTLCGGTFRRSSRVEGGIIVSGCQGVLSRKSSPTRPEVLGMSGEPFLRKEA